MPDRLTDEGREKISNSLKELWADEEKAAERSKALKAKPGQKKRGPQAGLVKCEEGCTCGKHGPAHNRKEHVVKECANPDCSNVLDLPPSHASVKHCSTECERANRSPRPRVDRQSKPCANPDCDNVITGTPGVLRLRTTCGYECRTAIRRLE
jgi:hypothetical protein